MAPAPVCFRRDTTAAQRAQLLALVRLALAPCPSYIAVPDAMGVRCIPAPRIQTVCPGCGDLIGETRPCRKMLGAQDAMLFGAQLAGVLDLDVELPPESESSRMLLTSPEGRTSFP